MGSCCHNVVPATLMPAVLAPQSLDFGTVPAGTTPAPQTVMLTAIRSDQTIDAIGITGPGSAAFTTGGTCTPGLTVVSGSTCTVTVTFGPGASGASTATLQLNTTGPDTVSNLTAGLTGRGAAGISSILIDPSAETSLVVGIDGAGIYRSTDRGSSWLPAILAPHAARVRALARDPGNSAQLYAGTYGSGVYRSTDGGATWNACGTSGLGSLTIHSLAINPAGRIYAGTGNGVYTSTDCTSWAAVNGGLP